jgi:hypothetical protein
MHNLNAEGTGDEMCLDKSAEEAEEVVVPDRPFYVLNSVPLLIVQTSTRALGFNPLRCM